MKIPLAGKLKAGPCSFDRFVDVLLGLIANDSPFRSLRYLFMANIGRIPDNRIKCWQFEALSLTFPIPRARCFRELAESLPRAHCKEVLANDARIVFFVRDVSCREVQRREVRWECVDIAAIYTFEQILIDHARVEVALAVISAHQEASASAGGVEHVSLSVSDAESVDDIYDIFFRVELPELLPLFLTDQLLKYVSESVSLNLFEVEAVNCLDNLSQASIEVVPESACSAAHSFSSGKKTGS